MLTWAHARTVTLRLIEPGKPNQNAYVESFNGRLRERWLRLVRQNVSVLMWRLAVLCLRGSMQCKQAVNVHSIGSLAVKHTARPSSRPSSETP